MFRVEFFCDDRKVGDALRSLMGIAIGTPQATPVINAEVTEGKIQAQSNGKLIEMFAHYVTSQKEDILRPLDIKTWLKKLGKSPLSSNYLVKQAKLRGLIRLTGKSSGTRYHVIRALPKPKAKGGTAHG